MSGAEIRIVTGDDYGAVLLGHRRDSVRVVGVGQVFLGVQVRREHQRLPVPSRGRDETAAAVPYGELVAAAAAST